MVSLVCYTFLCIYSHPLVHNMQEENRQPEQQAPRVKTAQNSLGIPVAIVIAGLLIAVAVFFSGKDSGVSPTQVANDRNETQETPEVNVAPVTEDDHILGNPNAQILIVEYSDFDCPFCKNFHDTMNRIMAEYGDSGQVAWVYRHFPIRQLHPNAEMIAEASECVADLGGNDAFWKFTNFVFNERGTNEPTDIAQLPSYAEQSGVSRAAYTTCMDEGRFSEVIQEDVQAAIDAGARGTPYSVIIAGDQQGIINGAQPYASVKQTVDTILSQLGSS